VVLPVYGVCASALAAHANSGYRPADPDIQMLVKNSVACFIGFVRKSKLCLVYYWFDGSKPWRY